MSQTQGGSVDQRICRSMDPIGGSLCRSIYWFIDPLIHWSTDLQIYWSEESFLLSPTSFLLPFKVFFPSALLFGLFPDDSIIGMPVQVSHNPLWLCLSFCWKTGNQCLSMWTHLWKRCMDGKFHCPFLHLLKRHWTDFVHREVSNLCHLSQ